MYVCSCVCVRVYVYVCLCVHVCMYVCEYVGICVCVCLECMWVSLCACMYVCECMCVFFAFSDLISFVCFTCKTIVACHGILHFQHPSNPVHLSMTPIEHGMSSLKVMHIDYKLINLQRYFTTGAVTSFSGM